MYDILVNVKINSATEEIAEQNVKKFLKMALLDFGLTYDIEDADLAEFSIEKSNNS